MAFRNYAAVMINGLLHKVESGKLFLTLAEYLRTSANLAGTKIVCAEGDCGACSVLCSTVEKTGTSKMGLQAVNSCIVLMGQLDGKHVVTVEGLAQNGNLHPAQSALISCHGSQCGFCTPGFAVTMAWAVEKGVSDGKSFQNHLTGNLCRCTGYKPIIEACNKLLTGPKPLKGEVSKRYLGLDQVKELTTASKGTLGFLDLSGLGFFAPKSLSEFRAIFKKNPKATLLGSGTDLGVSHNKGHRKIGSLISLHLIKELQEIKVGPKVAKFGAMVSLAEVRRSLEGKHPQLAGTLDLFASPQIKNVATFAGNIANASPIADTIPWLMTLNANVTVSSCKSSKIRVLPLSRFITGYRTTLLKKGEIITSIQFEMPQAGEGIKFLKVSQRKDLDIACVNLSVFFSKDKAGLFRDLRMVMGGVGPKALRLRRTESFIRENGESEEVAQILQSEISPRSDLRGSAAYRRVVAENLVKRVVRELS